MYVGVLTPEDIFGTEASHMTTTNSQTNLSNALELHKSQLQATRSLAQQETDAHTQNAGATGPTQAAHANPVHLRSTSPALDTQNVLFEFRRMQAAARREGRGLKVLFTVSALNNGSLFLIIWV